MILIISKLKIKVICWGGLIIFGFIAARSSPNLPASGTQKKYIAIVIDDLGGYAAGTKAMMALKYPLTLAVLPFSEFAAAQAEEAEAKGFEVIIHLPFESYQADPEWYGESYISATASREEIRKIIQRAFQILPMAVGLSNHMGSKATSNPEIIKIVLQELANSNRFYFDSKTSLHSPAPRLSRELTVPFTDRDIFLDSTPTRQHVRHQLELLMECANQKGKAIAIGHVGPFGPTLAAILREELPRLEKKGFKLVKLSQLVSGSRKTSGQVSPRIGIDPGHGGIDSGTRQGVCAEKDLNLVFSKRLAKELQKMGYTIIFSRTEDKLLTPYCHYQFKNRPYKRDDLERRLQKIQNFKASLIVSIHTNWSTLPFRKGALVFYSKNFPEAECFANSIQNRLNKTTGIRKIAKPGDYYLLNRAKIPAIIIELGYFSNHEELKLLHTNSYQDRLINAIVHGLSETCPL